MAQQEGIVGNNRSGISDGSTAVARYGRTGCLVVGSAHADYHEATFRGRVFHACTAVSGVAPGTALGTTSAFYLHNPIGSGVVLSIIHASMGYLSGTFGAGSVYYTTHAGVAVASPTGTAITTRNGLIGGNGASVGLAFTTATVTTQVALRPVWNFGPFLASSVLGISPMTDYPDGDIVVPPGYGLGIHSIATAGTSPLCLIGMSWEEVPVLPA
jgi:hypothetical protein